jgi:hypothetical protein
MADNSEDPQSHWGSASATAEAEQKPTQTESRGRIFVLENSQPRMVSLTLGATDLRQTVVKNGGLKAGDLVIIGENTPEADRTLLTPGGRGGRRF